VIVSIKLSTHPRSVSGLGVRQAAAFSSSKTASCSFSPSSSTKVRISSAGNFLVVFFVVMYPSYTPLIGSQELFTLMCHKGSATPSGESV